MSPLIVEDGLPTSKMPDTGWERPHNLRGKLRATPPSHRVSTKTLGAAYPFLAESGSMLTGPYIGENLLSRSPHSFDPWDAYSAGIIRSHSAAILGVKGTGKSFLAKSWCVRLILMGRRVAVPHDPNGEWVRVSEYVGGKHISIGPGKAAKLNLFDSGPRIRSFSDDEWARHLLATRRATARTIISLLNPRHAMRPIEHTVLDLALEDLPIDGIVTVVDLYKSLFERSRIEQYGAEGDNQFAQAARELSHVFRRVVHGDLSGLFDGPSTVAFDADAPMMVVDTSALRSSSKEAQALARLATTNWIRQATTGSNRTQRVIVHEEAAVELQNVVAGGEGLTDRVADEKVARHDGVSNWYLLHRIADLDALGDAGTALHSQALGLLADCDTRILYAQHAGEIARTAEVLGLNSTQARLVRKLQKGEGLWQIGADRTALVKNVVSASESVVYRTDALGGVRA